MSNINITEKFTDPDDRTVALRKLRAVMIGEKVILGRQPYEKVSSTVVKPWVSDEPERKGPSIQEEAVQEAQLVEELVETFKNRYRMVRMQNRGRYVLHEVMPDTREIAVTDIGHVQAQMRDHLLKQVPYRKAQPAMLRTLDRMQCDVGTVINETAIAPLLFEDQETERYCFRRLPFQSHELLEPPQSFKDLCRHIKELTGVTAVELWMGSLFDPSADRSQYLLLYGGGNNGKSTMLDALQEVLGSASLKMTSQDFMSRFGLSDAANKRVMIFDDNNNTSFMSSGDFKRITGSATLSIEKKGQDRFTVNNTIKVVIATNKIPTLSGDTADLRRGNLFVEMTPYEGQQLDSWTKRFREEFPDTLRYCYTKYRKHKEETGSSRIPAVKNAVETLEALGTKAEAQDFIASYFWSKDSTLDWLPATDISRIDTAAHTPVPAAPIHIRRLLAKEKVDTKLAAAVKELITLHFQRDRPDKNAPRQYIGLLLQQAHEHSAGAK